MPARTLGRRDALLLPEVDRVDVSPDGLGRQRGGGRRAGGGTPGRAVVVDVVGVVGVDGTEVGFNVVRWAARRRPVAAGRFSSSTRRPMSVAADRTAGGQLLVLARANDVLGTAGPCPLMVMSVGHGTLLHRSMDGPHRWLLRHCTSPLALVPSVRSAQQPPA